MDTVDRFVEVVSDLPAPPPGDARTAFRRGRRRRRRRRVTLASGTALGVAAAAALVVGLPGTPDSQLPEIADQPSDDALRERAPDAGAVDEHWPVELIYAQHERELRFRGSSWADWSVELRVGEDTWRLVDRQHPGEEYETEGAGAFLDEGTADEPAGGFQRAPGPHLISSWRDTTGLGDRTVVELGAVPGGVELVERMGLTTEDVEAYTTPNVVGCRGSLADCVPDGEMGARGIAHLPTGFPLFAEEAGPGYGDGGGNGDGDDDGSYVHLEARSIRWGDDDVEPVPADRIPRMSDHAAADAERAAETAPDPIGTLVDGTFELGEEHLWSAAGHPSDVATRFARQVLGWRDAEPIDLAGQLPGTARVTVREPGMREVTVHLEPSDPTGGRYGITRIDGRPDPELRIEEDRTLRWRPSVPREVAGGVALVRTPEDGTVRIELDQATTAAGRVPLDGHLRSTDPSCHRVQSALVAILGAGDRVLEITAEPLHGAEPPACP